MPIKVRSGGSWVQVSDGSDGADGASSIPSGTIVMYNQYSAPTGWSLCDGTNGTPDLRDKFIVGASGGPGDAHSYPGLSLFAPGGFRDVFIPQHTHSVTIASGGGHNHTYNTRPLQDLRSYGDADTNTASQSYSAATTTGTGNHTHTGTAANNTGGAAITNEQRSNRNLPPYIALTFIIKN